MLTIAVDAMGGDHAPKSEVEGAIRAASSSNVGVVLVGQKDVLQRELREHPSAADLPIRIHHASEIVTMDDSAAKAFRAKKDSSIRVACRLQREGAAQGVVSAGNTGACMTTAKMVLGMIPGVDRPALASAFPTLKGSPVIVIDVGANVDSTPEMLAQFAVMGEMYFAHHFSESIAPRRHSIHWRGRTQRKRADPRGHAAHQGSAPELHRQCGRTRHLLRHRRRGGVRRFYRQRGP